MKDVRGHALIKTHFKNNQNADTSIHESCISIMDGYTDHLCQAMSGPTAMQCKLGGLMFSFEPMAIVLYIGIGVGL
eukprot:353963-Pelagomonas_calceolata.AAC.2